MTKESSNKQPSTSTICEMLVRAYQLGTPSTVEPYCYVFCSDDKPHLRKSLGSVDSVVVL